MQSKNHTAGGDDEHQSMINQVIDDLDQIKDKFEVIPETPLKYQRKDLSEQYDAKMTSLDKQGKRKVIDEDSPSFTQMSKKINVSLLSHTLDCACKQHQYQHAHPCEWFP